MDFTPSILPISSRKWLTISSDWACENLSDLMYGYGSIF